MAFADFLISTIWIFSLIQDLSGCPDRCLCSFLQADCGNQDLTEVPAGVPPDVTTLGLGGNKLTLVSRGRFDDNARLTGLWMSRNSIVTIESGSLAPLVDLQNLDLSYNRIRDFPWADLGNLTALRLLKLSNNKMVKLPKDAFVRLRSLQSLHLNSNRFVSIEVGTFDGLVSLGNLRIFRNPFLCDCSLHWLTLWMSNTTVSVSDQDLITCAAPEELKGKRVGLTPGSVCPSPEVTLRPDVDYIRLLEGGELMVACEAKGNPAPTVTWHGSKGETILSWEASNEDHQEPVQVYENGTLLISEVKVEHSGNYSCTAKNKFGETERSIYVDVRSTDGSSGDILTERVGLSSNVTDGDPTVTNDAFTDTSVGDFPVEQNRSRICEGTRDTHYISNRVLNRSSTDDPARHVFNLGVISLGVSETDATVRLNPLLLRRSKQSEEPSGILREDQPLRLYLCAAGDHSSVQWTRVKAGVNTYLFDDLSPRRTYSLCLMDRQGECEVHVFFTTTGGAPDLLVIIWVSVCLLAVATLPLVVAVGYHLTYKHRNRTRNTLNSHDSPTGSQVDIDGSREDEEESVEEEKTSDSEESVLFQRSLDRENLDSCV